jgi:hypothetical protein
MTILKRGNETIILHVSSERPSVEPTRRTRYRSKIIKNSGELYYAHIGNGKYEQVHGDKVIFKGAEDFDLFLHKVYSQSIPRVLFGWRVSEGITGNPIFGHDFACKSRTYALNMAFYKLFEWSLDYVIQNILKEMEKGHISPRYLKLFPEEVIERGE